MTPEQATFLLHEVYLPQIRGEHKATRRVIEAIPADQCDYKPDPRSMSAMELAKHIASAEVFFMSGIARGAFDRADGAIPESVKTPAELLAWYDENFAGAVDRLAAVQPDDLAKDITFAIFTRPAVGLAGMSMSHSIHHRGQLSAYLRPMGAKVPRIYGGSADEPLEAPKTAAGH
jgi:uncharacterized damage-inducible protein DinB